MALAHPYNALPWRRRPALVATDKAGNTREMRLAYELKNVRKQEEHRYIGQLQNKVAPLLTVNARQGARVFLAEQGLRKENEDRSPRSRRRPHPRCSGKDALSSSQPKVEELLRTTDVHYNGEPIDIAFTWLRPPVTKNYPVEAQQRHSGLTGDLHLRQQQGS